MPAMTLAEWQQVQTGTVIEWQASVYVPAGRGWFHFHNGHNIRAATPLDVFWLEPYLCRLATPTLAERFAALDEGWQQYWFGGRQAFPLADGGIHYGYDGYSWVKYVDVLTGPVEFKGKDGPVCLGEACDLFEAAELIARHRAGREVEAMSDV